METLIKEEGLGGGGGEEEEGDTLQLRSKIKSLSQIHKK
jgi:hypothetical protein